MLIANVGTDRLGLYVVPFCLPLLSTLSITYITRENSCRCLYLFGRRLNDSMLLSCGRKSLSSVDREASKLPPF